MAYHPAPNDPTPADPLARVTTYTYDALNRLTRVIDPPGPMTTFVYDTLGRLVQVIGPDGSVTDCLGGTGGSPGPGDERDDGPDEAPPDEPHVVGG